MLDLKYSRIITKNKTFPGKVEYLNKMIDQFLIALLLAFNVVQTVILFYCEYKRNLRIELKGKIDTQQ